MPCSFLQVAIHRPGTFPSLAELFSVSPGTEVQISLAQKEVSIHSSIVVDCAKCSIVIAHTAQCTATGSVQL